MKTCLGLWSAPNIDTPTGEDDETDETAEADKVRIAAFLSLRRVALANDEALLDLVLKVRAIISILNMLIFSDRVHILL